MCTAIVDDEKDLIVVYQKALAKKGIPVCFVANDGLEAVKKFTGCDNKPSVVIMDYRLPVMNGIEATREMLKLEPETKIIFISGDISAQEDAIKAGAYHFLKKPTSIREITTVITQAMSSKGTA